MFDIGIGEVFIILVVALLVFGPDRLPLMAKQAASFVRDLRVMVANARRDLSSTVGELGIDHEDIKSLTDLRNPKSFVRKKVLDGIDLGIDEDGAAESRRADKLKGEITSSRREPNADNTGNGEKGTADVTLNGVAADAVPSDGTAVNGARPATDQPVLSAQRFDPDAT